MGSTEPFDLDEAREYAEWLRVRFAKEDLETLERRAAAGFPHKDRSWEELNAEVSALSARSTVLGLLILLENLEIDPDDRRTFLKVQERLVWLRHRYPPHGQAEWATFLGDHPELTNAARFPIGGDGLAAS